MTQVFVMTHDQARELAIEAVKNAPQGYRITINEPKRSLDQNAMLQPCIRDYGRYIGWMVNGVRVNHDELRLILMSAYRRATRQPSKFVVGLDGEPINLSLRTSELTKAECSEFIEMVNSLIAEVEA